MLNLKVRPLICIRRFVSEARLIKINEKALKSEGLLRAPTASKRAVIHSPDEQTQVRRKSHRKKKKQEKISKLT